MLLAENDKSPNKLSLPKSAFQKRAASSNRQTNSSDFKLKETSADMLLASLNNGFKETKPT